MKKLVLLIFIAISISSLASKKGDGFYPTLIPIKHRPFPVPNARQLAWQEAEMGAVFHYDLHVFDGKKYGQGENRITPVTDYQIFNPEKLNTDQWIKAAKDAGFKFAILTATHETGFALYQSDVNPYCLKAVKWRDGKGDIVKDFVESCRKFDVKPGIYLGIRWNSFFGVHNFKVNGEGKFRENRQKYYNQMVEGMVREICTRYGELFEIWFDGGADHPDNGAPDVLPIVKKYQPNCLFYHNKQLAEVRWGGSESGTIPYPCWATFPDYYSHGGNTPREYIKLLKHGDPDGKYWMPAMSDAPLRGSNGGHEWFWEPGDEAYIFPLKDLMNIYYKSVGRNSTLILGLTPDPDGLLPEPDVKRLKEWGDKINKQFGNPVAETGGTGNQIRLELEKAATINHIVIQEDIRHGERVREYVVEGYIDGKWKQIADGSCIGHKRIQFLEKPVLVKKIRLKIKKSIADPQIKGLQVFTENPEISWFSKSLEFKGIAVQDDKWQIWGCSPIIGPEGKTHLFVARWLQETGHEGWYTDSQIAHYVGETPKGPFKFSDIVLEGTGKNTWDKFAPHNPTIHKVSDTYALFYIANTGKNLRPGNQKIGLATSKSLYGPWEKAGKDGLILSPPVDSTFYNYGTTNGVVNPVFLQHPEERFSLYFKSNDMRKKDHWKPMIGLAIADKLEGPYKQLPLPITNNDRVIEDGYAFKYGGKIYLVTTDNHGMIERGGGLIWESDDGMSFSNPKQAFKKLAFYYGGELPEKANKTKGDRGSKFERPQILMIDGKPSWLYAPSGTNTNGGKGSVAYVLKIRDKFLPVAE